MGSKISNTGFWSGDRAHTHHVHCPNLADLVKLDVNDLYSLTNESIPEDRT